MYGCKYPEIVTPKQTQVTDKECAKGLTKSVVLHPGTSSPLSEQNGLKLTRRREGESSVGM